MKCRRQGVESFDKRKYEKIQQKSYIRKKHINEIRRSNYANDINFILDSSSDDYISLTDKGIISESNL